MYIILASKLGYIYIVCVSDSCYFHCPYEVCKEDIQKFITDDIVYVIILHIYQNDILMTLLKSL